MVSFLNKVVDSVVYTVFAHLVCIIGLIVWFGSSPWGVALSGYGCGLSVMFMADAIDKAVERRKQKQNQDSEKGNTPS